MSIGFHKIPFGNFDAFLLTLMMELQQNQMNNVHTT